MSVANNAPIAFLTLTIDYFPRESHLITFRDPWSFPVLYHPSCNNLVREHLQILAQKVSFGGQPPRLTNFLGAHSYAIDHRRLRVIRRVPKGPILQTAESHS